MQYFIYQIKFQRIYLFNIMVSFTRNGYFKKPMQPLGILHNCDSTF